MKCVINAREVAGDFIIWRMMRLVSSGSNRHYVSAVNSYNIEVSKEPGLNWRRMIADKLRAARSQLRKKVLIAELCDEFGAPSALLWREE